MLKQIKKPVFHESSLQRASNAPSPGLRSAMNLLLRTTRRQRTFPKIVPWPSLDDIDDVVDEGRFANTVEHRFLNNPAILLDLRKFATFEMRSHKKENLFVVRVTNRNALTIAADEAKNNQRMCDDSPCS